MNEWMYVWNVLDDLSTLVLPWRNKELMQFVGSTFHGGLGKKKVDPDSKKL